MLIQNSDKRDPMDPDHRTDLDSDDHAYNLQVQQYRNDVMDKVWRMRGRTKTFGLNSRARANFDRIKWGGK